VSHFLLKTTQTLEIVDVILNDLIDNHVDKMFQFFYSRVSQQLLATAD
jgi:hypothetical protein